ncbi:unnamed protein product [Coccothraustes coccothraustes]
MRCSFTLLSSPYCCPDRRAARWPGPHGEQPLRTASLLCTHCRLLCARLTPPRSGGHFPSSPGPGTGSGAVPTPQQRPLLPPRPCPHGGAARADDVILGSLNMAAVRALRGLEALAGPAGIHGMFASRTGLLRALRSPPACLPRDVSSPGFTRLRRAITQRAAARGPPEQRCLPGVCPV